MRQMIPGIVALFFIFHTTTIASEALIADKPSLKLLKKKPGQSAKKVLILRDGKRRVLVKVKKISRPRNQTLILANDGNVSETDSYEEYIYVDEEGEPIQDANTTEKEIEYVVFPDEPSDKATEAEADMNTSEELLSEEESFADVPIDIKMAPLPRYPSHYIYLAVGSASTDITTKLYTGNSGDTITVEPGGHTLTADGNQYTFEDNMGYTTLSFAYVYRPAMEGHAFYLGGYYDNHVAEARIGYHFLFPGIWGFYPGVKLTAGAGYENGDGYRPDAYSGGVSILIERRLSNNLIMGLEGGVVYRDWADVEEIFGVIDREDQETAIKLTISYGFM